MAILEFHTNVLGRVAADRLRNLYGGFLTFRSKFPNNPEVEVFLDDELLGTAKLVNRHAEKFPLGWLTLSLAQLGGFDSVHDQQEALKKSGYRFKPLSEYKAYPVLFAGYWGRRI